MPDEHTQLDKFKEVARKLETDDDPKRFKERVGKLVKHKPVQPVTGEGGMISAQVRTRGSDRNLGWWDFSDLPRIGEILAVTLNDAPASFEVASVIHVPIVKGTLGSGDAVPAVLVIVEEPTPIKDPC